MNHKRIHDINTSWQDLIMIVTGLIMLLAALKTTYMPLQYWYPIMLSGFALSLLGVGEMLLVWYWQDPQRLKRWHQNRLKHANSGVVWVWVVVLAGTCAYAIAFYSLVAPTLQLIGIVEGMTTWDANAAFTLNLVRTVLNWHPILFIIGELIWAFVNSQRREDITYSPY